LLLLLVAGVAAACCRRLLPLLQALVAAASCRCSFASVAVFADQTTHGELPAVDIIKTLHVSDSV